ncbi:MAG: monofunctional biosynthetic peptidoglycan transglycosylase [Candidatus Geothermincolia bacterium]
MLALDPPGLRRAAMKRLRRFLLRALLLAAAALALYEGAVFARILWWRTHNPADTAFMRARLDTLREKDPRATLSQVWVPYERISPQLKRAIVAAEDAKFLVHEGFDWEGIQVAYEKNAKRGKVVAGGSTISQQLAKNLFLSRSRTPWRKGEEALITVMLEAALEKRRILEIYLNVIEWGERIFGAEAAARRHFATSAAALDAGQAAHLAAMVPNPRYYEKRGTTAFLARQTAVIRARMDHVQIP